MSSFCHLVGLQWSNIAYTLMRQNVFASILVNTFVYDLSEFKPLKKKACITNYMRSVHSVIK